MFLRSVGDHLLLRFRQIQKVTYVIFILIGMNQNHNIGTQDRIILVLGRVSIFCLQFSLMVAN